ncbi:MAG TPA: aldehyde dehydrogenase family protein [Thermoanaerobaculia bacterium]|nr:aldehyde dehydrogenase family protein [Thermoanaerobaculia bacterium]
MTIAEIFETLEYGPAPESAEPAQAWLEARNREILPFIDGSFHRPERKPETDDFFDTLNPANAKPLARVAQCGKPEVDAAVAAARAAQPGWWKMGGHARARHLYAIARHIQKNARLLAVLETLDNGKPIRETRDLDIPLVARHFYHHAGWAQLMERELPGWVPVGVAGQIIPWNFPLLMLAWKIAPALAMGNTVVLKPAEFTPLTAIAFAEICRDAGLPKGVVNIVTGDGRTGELIVRHPDIDKLAFTGSTDVGRILREATAGSGKKLSLELGGKSPFLVFDDADLDSAVEGVVDAIWFNQGEVCCAGSRLLVHEGVAEALYTKLRQRMETLRVGDPRDKAIDIGAIIAPVQLERIDRLVKQGVEEGAKMWQPSWSCPKDGWFYPPTLFTGVEPAATIAQVEIFGPVLVAMTFRTPEEAIELANNTRFGLAASVWTENINLALEIAAKIKAGTVWINSTNLFDAASGFGGYRESGYGREGGREGLWEYVKPRWQKEASKARPKPRQEEPKEAGEDAAPSPFPGIDRTAKMYVGGKQARPDGEYSRKILDPSGRRVGEVGEGNRKDVRNAVEAARKAASGWAKATAHLRSQILYYVAENVGARRDELARRLHAMTGAGLQAGRAEVDLSIERLFTYAAWADKYAGQVQSTPLRNFTFAVHEPIGTLAILCPDEWPLLAFVSTVAPAVAMGNAVVAVPSERWPLAATDLYQVLDTSDVPGGVINILTGSRDTLAGTLAAHDDVDCLWYFGGDSEGGAAVERASIGNLKRTWVDYGHPRDWVDAEQGVGEEFLRQAIQVKNIWVPFGE